MVVSTDQKIMHVLTQEINSAIFSCPRVPMEVPYAPTASLMRATASCVSTILASSCLMK